MNVGSSLTATLQAPRADLPALYLRAKASLSECVAMDEVKDIGDKHDAIAVYARQAKDKDLMFYAKRIQLRAFERLGELLMAIESADERRKAAIRGGVQTNMVNRMVEAAHVPKKLRTKMIEAAVPTTKKRLWEVGRGYIPNAPKEGFARHARKEREVKVPVGERADDLVAYLQSMVLDLSMLRDDSCGAFYTWRQMADAMDVKAVAQAHGLIMTLATELAELKGALHAVKAHKERTR